MAENENYQQLYLDEKFKGVYNLLKDIKEQTTKTNGRVTELEKITAKLKLDEVDHVISCPQIKVIEKLKEDTNIKLDDLSKENKKINDSLIEYAILKKYPKIGLLLIAIACVALVVSTKTALDKLNKEEIKLSNKIENTK